MIKNCHMRHENGNCLPAGGFCTANKNICEALHNAYELGRKSAQPETPCYLGSPCEYQNPDVVISQPEPSIPLSWIEEHIEWLKSLDNEFASLAAAHISVMVKKWRSEQDDSV